MASPELFDVAGFLSGSATALSPAKRLAAEDFVHGRAPRYALGRNEVTRQLADAIALDGVVDDYCSESAWCGLPVRRGEDLPAGAIVVNTAVSIRPVSAGRRLDALSTRRWIDYAELMRLAPDTFSPPRFVAETRLAFQEHGEAFRRLYARLADEASRQCFTDVFQYRLDADPAHMRNYRCREDEQYFEPFLTLAAGRDFIDAGGYDGQTSVEFAARYPHYGSIQVFEPSQANLQRLAARLAALRDVRIHPLGLSDKAEELCFAGSSGSASRISEEGGERIQVDCLDNLLGADRRAAGFIKMDLEGWELKALAGARQTILEAHPILAIGAYHHPLDFVRIADYVLGLRDDYHVHLRHYTEGWSETVLYFAPAT